MLPKNYLRNMIVLTVSNEFFRYSSDDTDDDTASNTSRKKKATSTNRRQTMANPMPPPAPAAPVATGISRSPSKRRVPSRNSEPKDVDYDEPQQPNTTTSTTTNRSIVKTVQKKINKSYKVSSASNNDGLETGSDSDIPEESDKGYVATTNTKIFGAENVMKTYNSRKDRNSADIERPSKVYEAIPRASNILREEAYTAPPFKPNISPIASVQDEASYKRDDLNVQDLLAHYESPYLSEFTRRLSSQTSPPPRSTFKSE